VAAPRPSRAEPSPKYTPYVDRGQSLPAPYVYGALSWSAIVRPGQPTQLEESLGGGVGITSTFWIDGSVGTLRVLPALVFHSAQIGPNVLLVDTTAFELEGTLHVSFVADDGRPVEQVEPGLYGVLRAGHRLRVDAGLFLDASPGPTATFGLRFPLDLAFQITTHVHAVVNTGVTTASFADARGTTAIPLGVTLGWSDRVGQSPPLSVAVVPSIALPDLWKPGAKEPLSPGHVVVGITLVVVSKY
jgi:hypothetical protein